jgi:pyrroline-5-carboxylate reductase
MKPKDVFGASGTLKPLLHQRQLIVSLIAGLNIVTLESLFGEALAYVRSMPNTSATIGLGAAGISFSRRVSERQQELAADMFEASGIVSVVEEEKLDLVTGISGCGPAYIYYLIEALVNAGIEGGLTAEDAHQLAVQTAVGAANMLAESGDSPTTLRRKVSSPGGATMAAIEVLDRHQFGDGIVRAVFRAAERSKEMGDDIAESLLKERQ